MVFCALRERTAITDLCDFLKRVSLCSERSLEPLGVLQLTVWRLTVGKAPIGSA